MTLTATVSPIDRWCRAAVFATLIGFATSCGGGGDAGPTAVKTFNGVFPGVGSAEFSNFDAFPGAQGDVVFNLTWTVPAQGKVPVAGMTLFILGIPDRVSASSPRSATPPVTLTGSGSYLAVQCYNCSGLAPVPFTLTVSY